MYKDKNLMISKFEDVVTIENESEVDTLIHKRKIKEKKL